ncbi:unnamed protein product [Amaranthus hypochondriacus]
MAVPMKKTMFYNFFPTKKEEMIALATNVPYKPTATLIEIRDNNPNPIPASMTLNSSNVDPSNVNNDPWRIRKLLDSDEMITGRIRLTQGDVFEHIFRYISFECANNIVTGKKMYVQVCDVTDENSPIMYGPYDEHTYLEKVVNDEFVLGLNLALVRSRGFKKDDQIGIYYDPRNQVFYFKLFV